jgi:hypothetical protein
MWEGMVQRRVQLRAFVLALFDLCNGYIYLRIGTVLAGSCDHGNEPSESIKDGFLDQPSDCQLLGKVSTPWNWLVCWFATVEPLVLLPILNTPYFTCYFYIVGENEAENNI